MNSTDTFCPKTTPTHISTHTEVADTSETLAYLELSRSQCFAVAYALVGHCRRVGPPTTRLQMEVCGLRDFLLALLDEEQIKILLESI